MAEEKNEMKEENKTQIEETKKEEKPEEKTEKKKEEKGTKKKEIPKIKRTEASVNVSGIPISTIHSIYICKFIKGKKIPKAIEDLEEVARAKKAVPFKGDVAHKKGKGMMSGRYPKSASLHFIKLLKSLQANANVNGLEDVIITEAIANKGFEPKGRFGRVRRKRTNVRIKVMEKKIKEKKN